MTPPKLSCLTLRNKFIICLVSLVIFLTAVLGWISIKVSQQVLRDNIASFSQKILSQASERLGNLIDSAELTADKIILYDRLDTLLLSLASKNNREVSRARQELQYLLLQYHETIPGLMEIIILDNQGHAVSDWETNIPSKKLYPISWSQGQIKQWNLRYLAIHDSNKERILELNARIIRSPRSNQKGRLILRLKYQALESIMNGISLDTGRINQFGNNTVVYNPQGDIMFPWIASNPRILAMIRRRLTENVDLRKVAVTEEKIDRQRYLVAAVRNLSTGWEIYTSAPTRNLYRGLEEILFQVMNVGIFFVAAAIILAAILAFLITQPLERLEKIMHRVENGDLTVTAPETGPEEVRTLSRTFNKMLQEIDKLTKMLVIEEQQRKVAAIRALQAQITPHFLFNTLAALAGMTQKRSPQEVTKALQALMRLLHISIGREENFPTPSGDLIPLAEEFEHIQHYLYLMSIRYPNKFTGQIQLPPELRHFLTLRLILQPLVENSLQHGLKSRGGSVRVTAYAQDHDILIEIFDNGCGISPEQLNKLWQREREKPGVGVRNVDERLKLTFGQAYGLTIESPPEGGALVVIRIPTVPPHSDLVKPSMPNAEGAI